MNYRQLILLALDFGLGAILTLVSLDIFINEPITRRSISGGGFYGAHYEYSWYPWTPLFMIAPFVLLRSLQYRRSSVAYECLISTIWGLAWVAYVWEHFFTNTIRHPVRTITGLLLSVLICGIPIVIYLFFHRHNNPAHA